jgi:hypothetical protein
MPTRFPIARNRGCSSTTKGAIADGVKRLVEHRSVIAAVVVQRREVLVDDAIVVGEGVGRDEIAPTNLGAVERQLARGDVQ